MLAYTYIEKGKFSLIEKDKPRIFAAFSTVLAVCENILACVRELTGWSRMKGCVICGLGLLVTSTTTAPGFKCGRALCLLRKAPDFSICGILS